MNASELVVYKSGKDKQIYNIQRILGDGNCIIASPVSSNKTVSLESIRIASDTEILVGYRVK